MRNFIGVALFYSGFSWHLSLRFVVSEIAGQKGGMNNEWCIFPSPWWWVFNNIILFGNVINCIPPLQGFVRPGSFYIRRCPMLVYVALSGLECNLGPILYKSRRAMLLSSEILSCIVRIRNW